MATFLAEGFKAKQVLYEFSKVPQVEDVGIRSAVHYEARVHEANAGDIVYVEARVFCINHRARVCVVVEKPRESVSF